MGFCGKGINNHLFNALPNDKFLDWSKLKELADDKINVIEKWKFVLGMVENIVGKGENAGCQHFLLFPQCFQKASFSGIVWERVKVKGEKSTRKKVQYCQGDGIGIFRNVDFFFLGSFLWVPVKTN